jgi:ABC-type lipoprotein release transport system permease subunit
MLESHNGFARNLAAYVPARRASRMDPVRALKAE